MKAHPAARLKRLLFGLALAGLVTLNAEVARGDEVTISGSTTGSVTGVTQLSFAGNSSFSGTTALGVGALSGPNTLGTFSLSTAPLQSAAGTFNLNITFTEPAGIAGGQGTTYAATIQANVSPNVNQGGVRIKFNSPSQTFTFSSGTTNGSFTLTVAGDLFVQSGQSANLSARLSGAQSTSAANLLIHGVQGASHVSLFDGQSGDGDVKTSRTFDPTSDRIDFYESLEGIRVQVENAGAAGPTSFGEIPLLVDDGANASVPTPRRGIFLRANDVNPERIILGDTRSRPTRRQGAAKTI